MENPWHDLRKDPTDLPTKDTTLILYLHLGRNGAYCDGYFNEFQNFVIDGLRFEINDIIAWKYIEPFE